MITKTEKGGRVSGEVSAWGSTSPRRRALIGIAVLCASLGVILLAASSAFAARAYDSRFSPFNRPSSVGFDASGNVWVADGGQLNNPPGQQGIYKYNAYPSQTLLEAPNTYATFGFYSLQLQLAVDQSSGEVFVAQSNGRTVNIFDENGTFLRQWSAINGATGGGAASAGIHVAIDNTNTYSGGRVYLSLTSPENDIEAFDAGQRPVEFPATASYIKGNRLTGTPSGSFGEVQHVAVDASGNIYVTDVAKKIIDEFDSTGTFLRTFPTPRANATNPDFGGVGVDPITGNVLISEGNITEGGEGGIQEFDASGNYLGQLPKDNGGPSEPYQPEGAPGVNSSGYAYIPTNNRVDIYTPAAAVPEVTYKPVSAPTTSTGTLNATIDPNGGGSVTGCHFEYGASTSYASGSVPCSASSFSVTTDVSAGLSGLTTESTYHYRVVVTNANGTKYGADQTYAPHGVVGLRTDAATNPTENGATLHGSMLGDGTPTTYYFEWGPTASYGSKTADPPNYSDAGSPAGPNRTAFSFDLAGLDIFSTYHYRIVATNGSGTSYGEDQTFTTTPGTPSVGAESTSEVHSDRAVMHAQINPNAANTTYHFEYVDDADYQGSGFANASKLPTHDAGIGMGRQPQTVVASVSGLTPGTLYHYRAVATNAVGVGVPSTDHTFTTFPFGFNDTCANSHVRQQTGSALLLDCRAYELASAANSGGYDVESDLVAGQTPFGGYPLAEGPSQVLYGVHNGGIPGTGDPTNHGVDPYVATRGENGWTTRYVGIPANDPNATGPFASTLDEANSILGTFAFGGPDICSPCFSDGSSGTPVHRPDGSLVQGMAGSMDPGPSAEPEGYVGKHLSADGSHFVFGSTAQFEPDGNNNGDVSIYDRNLEAGVTHVVSKTPGGATMTGPGVGELDISSDGSRIVVGQLVSTDSAGNRYWHLYMNVGDSGQTIDLTPGTTAGVLYDGMSADGTKVYFTTVDALTGDDTDTSADIYRADVAGTSATLTRVSTGAEGTGNTDACEPAANTIRTHWNSVGSVATCDAVAVGGGSGVASGDGTIYFLSPERLDASNPQNQPVQDAPNLYIARPGSAPHFIRTLESSANAPLPAREHPFIRSFGSFPNPAGVAVDHANGDVYVFDIGIEIGTGYVYKFDSSGHAVLSFGINGKLTVSGVIGFYNIPTGIAVDNDPSSPNYGDLYVPDLQDGIVKKYDSSGGHLSDITGLEFPTSVAVDPSNGNVYVSAYFAGAEIFDTSGKKLTAFPTSAVSSPTGIAVDSSGNAYVVNGGGLFGAKGTTEVYSSSGSDLGQLDSNPSYGVSVDPSDDHVYVDEGNQAVEFNPSREPVGLPIGSGFISSSIGLAADSGTVHITNRGTNSIASYGPPVTPSDPSTDNPVVVDSVSSAASRNTADFQVSPSGDFAAFTSTLPLSGYDNAAHREVFRYDAQSNTVNCASCNPTGEQSTGEATLARDGLSLSDDGRVFFNSTEGLVDRDLNNKKDAYEWESGHGIELISTGTSPFASSLLGVSADATDAYFFTRDSLVSTDENGSRVKIYDARAGGGFPFAPAPIPCKASDECHGSGSQPASPPAIGSVAGTPIGNVPAQSGKCKPHHRCKQHHKRKHRRHTHRKVRRHG